MVAGGGRGQGGIFLVIAATVVEAAGDVAGAAQDIVSRKGR